VCGGGVRSGSGDFDDLDLQLALARSRHDGLAGSFALDRKADRRVDGKNVVVAALLFAGSEQE
jgi:hypothetical protein